MAPLLADRDKVAKDRVSLKLAPGQSVAAQQALDRIEEHVLKIAPHWSALTPAQREEVLAHSPALARFLALARQFEEAR